MRSLRPIRATTITADGSGFRQMAIAGREEMIRQIAGMIVGMTGRAGSRGWIWISRS
jgi:hypothetical protein